MKKILITGASGTVGKEITKQLCAMSAVAEITVFDKKTKQSVAFFSKLKAPLKIIYGDIANKNDVAKACKNIDIALHLAAVIPPLADKFPQLAKDVNFTGTKNLIDCLEEFSPDAFIIHASSVSVYGDRNQNPFIKVSDELKASNRDEYAQTKIEAEKLIMKSSLNWTIFRLCAIIGTKNHKADPIMFHMPLNTQLEILSPKDTAKAFIAATEHLAVLNKNIYNLGGGEKCRISYKELLSKIFTITGLGKLDFPENTFAEKNFHCGLYDDGHILNEILNFREDTMDDYFIELEKSVPPAQKIATSILRKAIKRSLQKKSEPLAAIRTNNKADLEHYF